MFWSVVEAPESKRFLRIKLPGSGGVVSLGSFLDNKAIVPAPAKALTTPDQRGTEDEESINFGTSFNSK